MYFPIARNKKEKKRKKRNKKKRDAEPEMGYCSLSIRQARSLGTAGRGRCSQGRAGGGTRHWVRHRAHGTAQGRRDWLRHAQAEARNAGARHRACGASARHSAGRGTERAAQARGTARGAARGNSGARPGRAGWASRLCTWCTQPV